MSNEFSSQPDPDYYVVGGTLQVSARSYVPRATDQQLLESLINGEYCYVLTARQMGKSSLMVRTAAKLKEFNICSSIIDLTSIGSSIELEAWYLGQIRRIVRQLRLHFDYMSWWRENASFSEVDRYSMFISEILLEKVSSSVVLFIDEIDSTLPLSYSDDFFAAIRSLYNQRAINSELQRLTFVLLGVASPSDLVKAVERTPFNIGRRIELNDFTWEEAKPLAAGLAPLSDLALKLLQRIIDWTGGHPYLTQKTCQVVAQWAKESWDTSQVDKIVENLVRETFFTERGKQSDDNLHFVRERLLRESQSAELINLYYLIRKDRIISDKERNLTHVRLKLIGIVKANDSGILQVRNRIYYEVFNIPWLNKNGVIVDDEIRGWQTINIDGNNYIGENHFHGNVNKLPLTQQEYRNRQALLAKVKDFWVNGVLEKSLHNQLVIEQGLEERIDAVASRENVILETKVSSTRLLPQGTKLIDIFDQINEERTLLIMGEPGSGKTTTLLELTRDLIARAEQDVDYPIPVVFNLSSWAYKKQNIADWLVEELNTKYNVPKKIGQAWIRQQQLILLLDGLDEVQSQYREVCVTALNTLHQKDSTEIVVCSRIRDYESLSNRLNFASAVYLSPPTLEQIHHYLDSLGADFKGLRALIEDDRVLQELAQSPLMLNIMMLAYQGVAVEDLPKTEVEVEERRRQLFNAYIERMFKRRRASQRYSKAQAMRWLIWLAQRMTQESQTIFLIERMQPSWLPQPLEKLIYALGGGITYGLAFGLSLGLAAGWSYGLIAGLAVALIFGLAFGLSAWLTFVVGVDRSVELIVNVILKAIDQLIGGKSIKQNDTESVTTQIPNQGIKESVKESARSALVWGLIGALFGGLLSLILQPEFLLIGALFGLTYGATIEGRVCILHFNLRLALYFSNKIPWNYARFLDYATERIFLQRIGGGYMFINRLLQEHFAALEPEQQEVVNGSKVGAKYQ
jgi:hypothetical protein